MNIAVGDHAAASHDRTAGRHAYAVDGAPVTQHRVSSVGGLLGGSAFVFACRVVGAGLTFLLQVALARWMGAAELGIYVLAFSWCILLSTVSQLGLPQAALRFVGQAIAHDRPGLARGYVQHSARIVVGCSLLIGLGFSGVVLLLSERLPGGAPGPFLIAAAMLPFYALINLQTGVANAFSWFNLAFLPSNVVRPLLTLVAVTAVWLLFDRLSAYTVMLVQFGVVSAMMLSLLALFGPRVRAAVGNDAAEYEAPLWVKTALPLLIASTFTNYFPEFTMIALGMFLPTDEVAIFNAAFRVALLIAFGIVAVDAITLPSAAQMHLTGKKLELQNVIARASQVRFWASLLGALVFVVFGQRILGLFGSDFVAGYDILVILVIAQLVRAGFGPSAELLSVTGHQNRCLVVFGYSLPASLLLLAVLAPAFGSIGAAAAVLAVMFGWNLWLNRLAVRLLDIRPGVIGGMQTLLRLRIAEKRRQNAMG